MTIKKITWSADKTKGVSLFTLMILAVITVGAFNGKIQETINFLWSVSGWIAIILGIVVGIATLIAGIIGYFSESPVAGGVYATGTFIVGLTISTIIEVAIFVVPMIYAYALKAIL